jgi:hypothetical protein
MQAMHNIVREVIEKQLFGGPMDGGKVKVELPLRQVLYIGIARYEYNRVADTYIYMPQQIARMEKGKIDS